LFNLFCSLFDVSSGSCVSIDSFNEYVFNNLRKPRKKAPQLAANISNFYNNYSYWFTNFLQGISYTLLFESHKNVWIFQKCLHSSIVMNGESQAPQTMVGVVLANEQKEERQKQLLELIQEMLSGIQPSLDLKSRDAFNPKFN
jgi:hypothetical protein